MEAMQAIAIKHVGHNVLVVSHGCFIKSVLNKIGGHPLDEFWKEPMIANCSYVVLDWTENAWRLAELFER